MRLLLDTDVVSGILTGRASPGLRNRLELIPPALQHISAITLGELLYGMERSGRHAHLLDLLESRILPQLTILSFDEPAAREYAVLRVTLERQGQMLDDADLRIAAIALANGLALVTGNDRHFRRVPGLRVYNWLESPS
jgi:tRNA(fMet)-specific endonuclease VapC